MFKLYDFDIDTEANIREIDVQHRHKIAFMAVLRNLSMQIHLRIPKSGHLTNAITEEMEHFYDSRKL